MVKTINMGNRTFTVEWVGEVLETGETLRVAKGGKGGRGNFEFRSSTHTTPHEAETGETGEAGVFFFELQVLADVGFVGFPNAGKSTLLSVITTARPQIANYPFTTLEPNLGILDFPSHKEGDRANFVIADIPGIIEGASEGKGLGTAFLRHIERCRMLLFVLSVEDYEVLDHADDAEYLTGKLLEQYNALLDELREYEEGVGVAGDDIHWRRSVW
jgi:GTPase